MRRREFITLLGGAAVTWQLAASAQQPSKTAKIGILGSGTPATQGQWWAGFVQRLRELGWTEGRTVAIEYRWAEGRSERAAVRRQAMSAHRSLLVENRTTYTQCELFAF
jgi:putative tryptophan/tyrosine transport system substrate-binding protein